MSQQERTLGSPLTGRLNRCVPRAVLSRTVRELARKNFRITVLIAVEIKLVQKIRAKDCKSSESSVYIVVAVYSVHAFPEDCL